MDPITTAIVSAVGKLAEPAVKEAYEFLKGIIRRKFSSTDAPAALEELERKPDSAGRRQTLSEELAAIKAADDHDLLAAAQRLLESLPKARGDQQIVEQTVTGDQNIFSGTGNVHVKKS